MAITFQLNHPGFNLKNRTLIKEWIVKTAAGEKKSIGQLNFLFTSDEELLRMNIEFLNHDTLTDIITFGDSGEKVAGDIIISAERVHENAKKFKVSFDDELRRVMIHGVLHLCGYKDKTAVQKKEMRAKEDSALRLFKRL